VLSVQGSSHVLSMLQWKLEISWMAAEVSGGGVEWTFQNNLTTDRVRNSDVKKKWIDKHSRTRIRPRSRLARKEQGLDLQRATRIYSITLKDYETTEPIIATRQPQRHRRNSCLATVGFGWVMTLTFDFGSLFNDAHPHDECLWEVLLKSLHQ